jgi:mycothiol synthase
MLAFQAQSDTSVRVALPDADDLIVLQEVWAASQNHDEPAGRPRGGWWSIAAWATAGRVLTLDDAVIGFAAIEYRRGADAAEARLGLLPEHRSPGHAEQLVQATVDLAQESGASRLWLYAPEAAVWAIEAARQWGFRPLRTQNLMLRPPDAAPVTEPDVPCIRIRPLRVGEDPALLAALNRAWAGTWNFRPITATALANDLRGQRAGMLVAVVNADESHIIGTAHALFDPTHRNPDGGPYAWISNLTTDPEWRGRGLGRALLAAGLTHAYERGARSIALSVDGSNTAALQLYRSAGFMPTSTVAIWERAIDNRVLIERSRAN